MKRRAKPDRAHRLSLECLEPRMMMSASAVVVSPVSSVISSVESIDGSDVNAKHPTWGEAGNDLLRVATTAYGDGISTPSGSALPSAREISDLLGSQSGDVLDDRDVSAFIWAWGQFIDHDLDLTPTGDVPINIAVPSGDPQFDPDGTGTQVLPDTRSVSDPNTGTSTSNPLENPTVTTSWLDGSMIYGSDTTRAAALRTMEGGHLATSAGDLLAFNTAGLDNANEGPYDNADMFVSGDVRTNENIVLTSLITLFVREHNYWADTLHVEHPTWTDEQLYDGARAIVIGEIQEITYNEYLPALGISLPNYKGYNANVNPGITAEFSEAAFRFGHSQLDNDVQFVDADGNNIAFSFTLPGNQVVNVNTPEDIADGDTGLPEVDVFFDPYILSTTSDPNAVISGIFKYLSSDVSQAVDLQMVDGVRNVLFGAPGSGAGGQDLFALDIQRDRDMGLNTLNQTRIAYGLEPYTSFAQITSDVTVQKELKQIYGNVNNVELFVGGLAENHLAGSSLGSTFTAIIADQFQRLRDGDPYFYLNQPQLAMYGVDSVTLSDIIARNTGLTNLQSDVFFFKTTIGGEVFNDKNDNGSLQRNEQGVAGVVVNLLDSQGDVVATTTTDAKGHYIFKDVGLGSFTVQVTPPPGATVTSPTKTITFTKGGADTGINMGLELAHQHVHRYQSLCHLIASHAAGRR
ncbi:MAG TPA: peroxidase family protein [Pirellulales bacterium]|nr:peroxidase family protein [Pirellulales bacterium]